MTKSFTTLGLIVATAWLSSCASRPLPPVNLAEIGWQVHESLIVWKPKRTAPELFGELLVATHPDGRRLIQLSKQSLPLITAESATNGWMITSTLRRGQFGGSLPATDRVPWFLLESFPPHPPANSRWQLELKANGVWHMVNSRTGEYVEGTMP